MADIGDAGAPPSSPAAVSRWTYTIWPPLGLFSTLFQGYNFSGGLAFLFSQAADVPTTCGETETGKKGIHVCLT